MAWSAAASSWSAADCRLGADSIGKNHRSVRHTKRTPVADAIALTYPCSIQPKTESFLDGSFLEGATACRGMSCGLA